MSTAELRSLLIDRIAAIKDKTLLFAIKNLIETNANSSVYKTSANQKKSIEEGMENIRDGKYFTNDQIEAEANQWQAQHKSNRNISNLGQPAKS